MGFLLFQDSGIIEVSALGADMPLSVKNSKTLSREALSLMPGWTIGEKSETSGKAGLERSPWRPSTRGCRGWC